MLARTFDYDARFRCLAGGCPKTCCAGWQVVVDGESAAFYKTVPGELGARLRAALTQADGETRFALRNGRCPFLEPTGLCELHRRLGERCTGATCRAHPRFTEEYGALRETLLSASCPAAAALLTESDAPLTLTETEDGLPGEWTDPWLAPLLDCRARAAALLRDRRRPLRHRLAWFLLFSNEAQALLEEDRAGEVPALCGDWADLPDGAPALEVGSAPALRPALFRTLRSLEVLEGDWLPLLALAEASPGTGALSETAGERLACYFLARYFLRAVNDGDLLSRACLAVFGVLAAQALAGQTATPAEAVYRLCREVEHSRPNLERLQNAFCTDPALGLAAFLRALTEG